MNDQLDFQPDRGWREWYIDEIYPNGNVVPNVDDAVFSWVDGRSRVTEVDLSTGMSTLKPYSETPSGGTISEGAVLAGGLPVAPAKDYMLYINTSVIPYKIAVDNRVTLSGSDINHIKIFLGDLKISENVVSRMYDNNGTLLGENIPLEIVKMEDSQNVSVKVPLPGFCSHELKDGELVTLVAYDINDNIRYTVPLITMETNWIRQLEESRRFVESIELISPFLSKSEPTIMEVPVNIPMQSVTVMGKVNYSDKRSSLLNIDGSKFELLNFRDFNSTRAGTEQPMTLIYRLSEDEIGIGNTVANQLHISAAYRARALQVDGAYSLKIYTYPVWVDFVEGYRLEHFLCNLDRNEIYPVTDLVEIVASSATYDPLRYGVLQKIKLGLDLSKVSPLLKAYHHIQTVGITLVAPGTDTADRWRITHDEADAEYGPGIRAKLHFINTNLWKMRVDCDQPSVEAWLREVYWKTYPMYDPTAEAKAPEPNYIRIRAGVWETEVPISMWSEEFTFTNTLDEGENVYIEFIRRDSGTDHMLSVAGLSVDYV